jgi:NAD(P)-dependent dehydrogenase (short-subunit alcohol dehydrogenase family)
MFDLSGHTAVVTGGNRGIGLGFAVGLAKAGASVSIWSRNAQRNHEAVTLLEEHGVDAASVACDVTDEDAVAEATSATVERFGRIDSLFANAGTSGGVSFPDLDLATWDDMMTVNVTGTLLPVREVARHMLERGGGGSIVVTSSIGATHGLPVAPHYSASKAAQLGLVKALAVKLGKQGIRVNAVCPGWVSTELTAPQQEHEAFQESIRTRVPLRRWGSPEDFEGIAVYLASPASAFMTGTEIILDGGYSAF